VSGPGAPREVVMWEARAADGRVAELAEWAGRWAGAQAAGAVEVYLGEPDRVVVVHAAEVGLPAPPAELLARAPHSWAFRRVTGGGLSPGSGSRR
jgi:hypothetical protein